MACNCQNSKDFVDGWESDNSSAWNETGFRPAKNKSTSWLPSSLYKGYEERLNENGGKETRPIAAPYAQTVQTSGSQSVYLVDMPVPTEIDTPKAAVQKSALPKGYKANNTISETVKAMPEWMKGSQENKRVATVTPFGIMTSEKSVPSPILGPKPQNLDVKLNINYDEENHTIKLAVLINGENYEYSPMPISEFAQKLGIPRFDEFNHLERMG